MHECSAGRKVTVLRIAKHPLSTVFVIPIQGGDFSPSFSLALSHTHTHDPISHSPLKDPWCSLDPCLVSSLKLSSAYPIL